MSITRDTITAQILVQYKRADKTTEINQGIQYIVDDIALHFSDFKGLKSANTAQALTTNTASIDISTTLETLYGRRIEKIVLIDSANYANNITLNQDDELDFVDDYLELLPDPSNPQAEHKDIPKKYAPYGDLIYFWKVPNISTLTAKIYFGKVHPTVSGSVDILYPTDFANCICEGVLFYLYKFAEKKDQFSMGHYEIYRSLRDELILAHSRRPNERTKIACLDL